MGEELFLFLSKLFWNIKPETECDGWKRTDLQRKRNPSILSSSKNAVEIPENETAIILDIKDYVAAGFDRKVYIDKGL